CIFATNFETDLFFCMCCMYIFWGNSMVKQKDMRMNDYINKKNNQAKKKARINFFENMTLSQTQGIWKAARLSIVISSVFLLFISILIFLYSKILGLSIFVLSEVYIVYEYQKLKKDFRMQGK
ncbi:MAG: hypothetical protein KJ915_10115, partial [Candidatus Omnitrophica bacterium]|nr:hypothetical protein [Candidatus Omnitrophota bacterium]